MKIYFSFFKLTTNRFFPSTSVQLWLHMTYETLRLTVLVSAHSYNILYINELKQVSWSINPVKQLTPVFIPLYATHFTLQWRHNEHDGVSNHKPHDCLLKRLSRRRSKKTSNVRVTGLCEGNSPGTGEFPAQRSIDAENVSIWWHHHEDNISVDSLQKQIQMRSAMIQQKESRICAWKKGTRTLDSDKMLCTR